MSEQPDTVEPVEDDLTDDFDPDATEGPDVEADDHDEVGDV